MPKLPDLKADLEKFKQLRPCMKSYQAEEEVLCYVVNYHPSHAEKEWVAMKVELLNNFYSTGILAIDALTDHIFKTTNIDERLEKGDQSLISEIAELTVNGKKRINYSFATKYCALHEPSKFPIYDSIVAAIFTSLFMKGLLPGFSYSRLRKAQTRYCLSKAAFEKKLHEYDFFVEVYDCFMKAANLTDYCYRQVDNYLWGSHKLSNAKYGQFEIEKIADIAKNIYQEYKEK